AHRRDEAHRGAGQGPGARAPGGRGRARGAAPPGSQPTPPLRPRRRTGRQRDAPDRRRPAGVRLPPARSRGPRGLARPPRCGAQRQGRGVAVLLPSPGRRAHAVGADPVRGRPAGRRGVRPHDSPGPDQAGEPDRSMLLGEVLREADLPIRLCGISTCFRREAGAHGKDTRGMFRVHQFDKVEMFSYCHPDRSWEEHDYLVALQERLWKDLGLPYRVVDIAAGDLGDPAARKYDIETWMPGRGGYGETQSCSNCTDFQARGLNIRFRPSGGGGLEFVHTLNGTAVAGTRAIIAILENGQQADGSVRIPPPLVPYLGGRTVLRPPHP
ncbi:MAG: serine--tRNA ligase, partial [Bacillati bacterium ANGP1]